MGVTLQRTLNTLRTFTRRPNRPRQAIQSCRPAALKHYLQTYPDQLLNGVPDDQTQPAAPGLGMPANASAFAAWQRHHLLGFAVSHIGDVESLRLLIDEGIEPNVPPGAENVMLATGETTLQLRLMFGYVMPFIVRRSRNPPHVMDMFAMTVGASALHSASVSHNQSIRNLT